MKVGTLDPSEYENSVDKKPDMTSWSDNFNDSQKAVSKN